MTRKKILVVIFFALMMVAVLVSCTREKEILIGFAGQLTGVYSDLGVQGRNGAVLALEEINAGGGVAGKRLKLIPEDDGNTPEKARQAVRKLIQQDAYTAPFHQHFIHHFEQSGGRIAANCTFSSQDSGNWSEVLACLQLENTPGVLIMASARDVISIIQAMGASGKDNVLLSSGWGATQELLSQGGRIVDGLYLAKSGFLHEPDSTYTDFERLYKNRFGRVPSFAAVQGYDALRVLALALRQTGGDSRGLPRALAGITDFASLYGTLSLDSFGDAHLPGSIFQIRNGQFEHQWTAEPENENRK
ncbi:MAG: ABC transporter substrate-binding protein [Desulfobacteraceae bacterium]|nr:ABC transporter substrate-binding protein [Desulfobacteraceae bacterium]